MFSLFLPSRCRVLIVHTCVLYDITLHLHEHEIVFNIIILVILWCSPLMLLFIWQRIFWWYHQIHGLVGFLDNRRISSAWVVLVLVALKSSVSQITEASQIRLRDNFRFLNYYFSVVCLNWMSCRQVAQKSAMKTEKFILGLAMLEFLPFLRSCEIWKGKTNLSYQVMS